MPTWVFLLLWEPRGIPLLCAEAPEVSMLEQVDPNNRAQWRKRFLTPTEAPKRARKTTRAVRHHPETLSASCEKN